MATLWVVEHLDVIEDIGTDIVLGQVILAAIRLALEQLKEAHPHRVVMAIATPAHAADQVGGPQETPPIMARKLTAQI